VRTPTRSAWHAFRPNGRVAALVLLGLGLSSALRACLSYPFLDDGRFRGAACETAPGAHDEPADTLELLGGSRLESYPPAPGANAPRVVLRRPDGSLGWCVRAEGQAGTEVRALHFEDASVTVMPGHHVVTGMVDWTFGEERTTWWLRADGALAQYWYSW
jgi:hypothetical protein